LRALFKRKYLFHLFFWITYTIYFLMDLNGYIRHKGWLFALAPVLINMSIIALLAYGNILFLIPKLLQKKKIVLYIPGVLVFLAVYTFGRSFNQQYWDSIVWPDSPMEIHEYLHWNFLNAIWLLMMSSLLYYSLEWSDQQQKVKNIQINQLETELKYLRNQVNPHFLFNGLNTIYGNIDMKDQKARDILLQFSDLLRYNLYEADVDWVDIEREAAYLQNYVALQRARSDSNLQIELNIDITDKNTRIAPLLFIPFVENAFKFSTRDDNTNNYINISLHQKNNIVTFHCDNSYEDNGAANGGIGYSNVKRRLELLYHGRYTLTIHKDEKNYSVQLTLIV
jgi:two-component system, LytTR family, sensor kinase